MMRSIIGTSLQFRFLVVAIAAVLMLFGITRLREMPVDVLPEFAPPFVEIQTEALGLSTAEVEQLISLNLEELLSGVPWVKTIRSRSVPGLSSVILVFEPGTDLLRARQLVQERLTLAHMLPNVSKPPVILQPLSATSRVMMIGFSSKDVSAIDMSVLARWNIRPALMGVPGVANVSIWGQRERQLQVQVDPEQLRAQRVTLDQIISTTGDALWVSPLTFLNASTPGTGGWIDTPQQRLEVRHVLPISSPSDLAKVIVDGTSLRLGQVARVEQNHQPLIGDAVLKNGPGLLFVVEKFPNANSLQVTRKVEATLEALRPGLKGIEMDTAPFRPASFIEMAMDNLGRTLLIGAALVLVVLFAFLFEWRAALISIVSIALSMVVALLVLNLRGATLNVMILAGLVIALAAVVDDAIIDVENIVRRLRQRQEDRNTPMMTVVLEAALEMRSAVGFAAVILLVAVAPLFFLEGVSGSFFQPLALSYVLAVLASMIVALFVTPALSLMLLSNTRVRHESGFRRWIQGGYERILNRVVKNPVPVFALTALALVAGVVMVPFLRQQSLLPSFREPSLMIQWDGVPGTSHPAMTRLAVQASRELQAIPGVTNVTAHVGRAVLSDQVVGINSAQLWVNVDPKANYDQTLAAVQDTVESYPGTVREVRTYLQETLRQSLSGSSDAMVVRILGPAFDVLRQKAAEVRQVLSQVPGVTDLNLESQVEEPYIEITVDLAKAERYGIKPGDVRRAAATLINGLEVGSLFENQKVFEVVVWSTPETRQSLTSIRELLIDTPRGGHVRLQDVANVRVTPTLHTINREAISRRVDVGFNVTGRDLGVVAQEVRERLQGIDFPLEYHAELLGEYAERQATQDRLLLVGIVAALGMFFVLQASFRNWLLAFFVFLTIPVALSGGVLAAFLASGGSITLGFLLGLLTLLGLTVRSSVVMVNHYQHLEQREGEAFGSSLILRGARERLVPILMTACATGLALLPFLIFGGSPGHEVQQPMVIVILGGLVTSTLLNLFAIPALYLRFGVRREADLGLLIPAPSLPGSTVTHP